jgi:NAD-dependent DNA ligase
VGYNIIIDKKEAKKRIEKLSAEINELRYEYHVLDKPDWIIGK